jgi:hypothetical protein
VIKGIKGIKGQGIKVELTRFHGQLKVLDLVGIFHQICDGGFAVV